jgi:hypothetical protein
MATREVEAMHFIAKYNFNLSHILIKINPISLYNFCEKWLDTLHYLLPIQIEKNVQDFPYRLKPQINKQKSEGLFF